MIDETASSERIETRQQVSVLYDPETGRAVRGHTFVGVDDELSAPDGREARERVLREDAGAGRVSSRLRFADASADLRIEAPAELEVIDDVVAVRPVRLRRRNLDADVLRTLPPQRRD
ncbi:hypothetical protein [Agromyces sp. Leaf222]|uniref:hypothetical protein n=1 Tax=Agromyces sp. Leaf222 TaxID=1735688 RepID=UPI0006F4425E|nr:hypothetical protein [Agromyces sp. Leaf222]KQM83026.1 hypothetical protein ASE68_07005 [Agromyces sp. Leaf222]